MIRTALRLVCGLFIFTLSFNQDVAAQNIFLTPNNSKSEDSAEEKSRSVPSFIINNKAHTRTNKRLSLKQDRRALSRSLAEITKSKLRENQKALFESLNEEDLVVLQKQDGVPKTPEQYSNLNAIVNIPMAADILKMESMLHQAVVRTLN